MVETPEDPRGGDVVPFPSGSRHPSQWPVEEGGTGYCFYCDAPAERDPCPECGRPLWQATESEPSFEEGAAEEEPAPPEADPLEGEAPESGLPLFDFEEEGLEEFTSEQYVRATTHEYRGLAEEMLRASQEEYEPQAVAAAMRGVESGVVGFEDVTGEAVGVPAAEPSDLAVRVGSGAFLGALFLGALWAGGLWFLGLVTVVGVMALGELYATLRRRGYVPAALFGLLGAVAVVPAGATWGPAGIGGVIVAAAVVLLLWYAVGLVSRNPLGNASVTLLGLAWVPGLLAFVMPIAGGPDFRLLILAAVVVTVAQDTGAYFVGRTWGRTALAPVLSPRKTVEGLVGGVVTALAVGALVSSVEPFDLRSGLGLGAVVALFAPLGDLSESMVKRSLGVKDMGSVLPGHGGLLDRIDALLFVVPAVYVLYRYLGLIG